MLSARVVFPLPACPSRTIFFTWFESYVGISFDLKYEKNYADLENIYAQKANSQPE